MDSLEHRICYCRATADQRKGLMGNKFKTKVVTRMINDGSLADLVRDRFILEHRGHLLPPPAQDMVASYENHVAPGQADTDQPLDGRIFMDGSCYPHCVSGLARASWSIVQCDRLGQKQVTIKGTVPGMLPQTSPVAEGCAYLAYLQYTAEKEAAPQAMLM